jgi:shikimate kinase
MAAGKTSIGKLLAAELQIPFYDTDALIAETHGSISDIFDTKGENVFRALEEDVTAKVLSSRAPCVVSLGGGAVLSAATRELLLNHTVILLMTTEEAVLARANLDKRPLLKTDPSAWARLLEERLPFYEEVAKQKFDTSRIPKEQSVKNIIEWLKVEGAS